MTEKCIVCGVSFEVIERHPMVTNDQWCPSCFQTIAERLLLRMMDDLRYPRSIRADDV